MCPRDGLRRVRQIGSLKRCGSQANAAFDPLQCPTFAEDVQTIMSSANTARSDAKHAKARGDEDDRTSRATRVPAAKPLNGVAPHRQHLAKSRPRSALPSPSRFGVHVRGASQGSIESGSAVFVRSLAVGRPSCACGARDFRPFHPPKIGPRLLAVPPMRRGRERARRPHEICQWPTKCSSTRPIRRRPGW